MEKDFKKPRLIRTDTDSFNFSNNFHTTNFNSQCQDIIEDTKEVVTEVEEGVESLLDTVESLLEKCCELQKALSAVCLKLCGKYNESPTQS